MPAWVMSLCGARVCVRKRAVFRPRMFPVSGCRWRLTGDLAVDLSRVDDRKMLFLRGVTQVTQATKVRDTPGFGKLGQIRCDLPVPGPGQSLQRAQTEYQSSSGCQRP